jgi:hyaluronate lyase
LLDKYGVSGMQLAYSTGTLTAKKSWFMFDNEIVALGAGITSTESAAIETTVENRRIAGSNTLTVNGVAQPATLSGDVRFSSTRTNRPQRHQDT